jgi:flagellar hook-length control protein FliK
VVLRSGGLQATIIADNPQVKAALEDQLAQIKEAMAEQGLDFQRFDVSTRDDRQAGYSDREQRRTRERGETEEAADTVLEAAALGLRPAGDSLVDRMI